MFTVLYVQCIAPFVSVLSDRSTHITMLKRKIIELQSELNSQQTMLDNTNSALLDEHLQASKVHILFRSLLFVVHIVTTIHTMNYVCMYLIS